MKIEKELPPVPAKVADVPICPYCGQDPALIGARPIQLGNMQGMVVFCAVPECRKIITVSIIGVVEPQRIATPGGLRLIQ